ncbi:IS5 family transposase [Streptomyces sp. NPDC058086]|uniref:IS5 family transposase n=1 Tax=Streptomyces sp. NPDC058086 TaxID=3346334 RepID=UPI0036E3E7F3
MELASQALRLTSPDGLWELFQRVVPPTPGGPGVIVFVATSGCTWNRLPPGSGPSGVTAFRWFAEWSQARVWAKFHCLILDELGSQGELDWSRCAIDSVSVQAVKGWPLIGPNPTDRGKSGSKFPLVIDRRGLPISLGKSAANTHDGQALQTLVQGIPPIRSRHGPRRRRPVKLRAHKGYDCLHLRRWLRTRGIVPRVARRGIENSTHLGRHRWVVERTFTRLTGCQRLHRRYARKPDHFLAFTVIAATLICYHRLPK